MEETIVISLGGSLIIPDQIDVEFLKNFKKLILAEVAKGKKFLIITGGGKLCRRYQEAVKEITSPSKEDLDWIGIASLKLNAELIRVIFEEFAFEQIILNPSEPFSFEKPIVIGAAYRPGGSTDWDAVLGAKTIKAKKIINLSNIAYVYDSDPKKNPEAKKFERISWTDYRKLIPAEWNPGFSSPFDPIASKLAEELGMEVIILKGEPLSNFENYLNGKEFLGTVIF
jgi:uridylate kinase